MNRFKQIYNKIIKQSNITDIQQDFIYKKLNNYEVISENTIKIIDQYVEDPQLTPIPKEILNIICSKVKYRKDNITIISMKELYYLLRQYDYPYYLEFKQQLKNLDGNLYIIMLFQKDDKFKGNDAILAFNSTFQFLLQQVKDIQICKKLCNQLLKDRFKNADAFCSKQDKDISNNTFFKNNCLIYISLKCQFIKDSLQHQLTHFIQKTVGLNKSLTKIYNDEKFNSFQSMNKEGFNNLYKLIKEFSDNDNIKIIFLINFFKIKFQSKQLDQSIKAVLNGIQRIYQYGKLSYINQLNYFKRQVDKKESQKNIKFRLQWLDKFLKIIHSKQFIINDLKYGIFNCLQNNQMQLYMIKYRYYFIILLYLGFQQMFKKLNIQQKIIQHFKIFKYKDN